MNPAGLGPWPSSNPAVPHPYAQLLQAALDHVLDLKAQGRRWLDVQPETLALFGRQRPGASRPPSPAQPATSAGGRPSAQPAVSVPNRPAEPPLSLQEPAPFPTAPALRPPGPPEDRRGVMAALRVEALGCTKCPHLVRSRTQVVFGVGNEEAELMFVGEAPGADEDRLGEPFVGRAGQLLTRIIVAMGFTRESVYIANVLKCRPDLPPGTWVNRPPRPEEIDACKPYLLRQIELIAPRVIVALGATAVHGLLGVRVPMNAARGKWREFRGIPLMATFHPSYLLRCEEAPDRGHSEKRKTWEDMLLVLDRLGRPITDRMRGFFLKPPTAGSGS